MKLKLFTIVLLTLFISACSPSNNDKIVVETILDNEAKTWIGQDLPLYPKGSPRISVLKFTVPAKQKLPKHFHSVINVAYMLKGELLVRDEDGNEKIVKAGETLVELVNKVHYGENISSKTAELIVLYINDHTNIPITTKVE